MQRFRAAQVFGEVREGDGAAEASPLAHHEQLLATLVQETLDHHLQGLAVQDRRGPLAHHVPHLDGVHHELLGASPQAHAPLQQRLRVNGVGMDQPAHQQRRGAADHQRQNGIVVSRQLEDGQNGGEGCLGRAGDHGAHSHQGVGAGTGGQIRESVVAPGAVSGAQHRTNEKRGSEKPAGAPRAQRQRRGDHFQKRQ